MKRQNLRVTRKRGSMVEGELLTRPRKERKPPRDNLFGWTVFLLVLIGVVFACWIGSFYVFQHPENPESYAILRKLKKIDPPKRFEPTAAPRGRFFSTEHLAKLYNEKTETELDQINTDLIQAYIGNYGVKEKEVPYLMGRFTILKAQPLTRADVFTTGYVVLARSVEDPKLLIEQLYPADGEYGPDLERMLTPGVDVKLERTYDLSAVLHVEKLGDGTLQVTIVPLNYDSYGLGDGREVHLSPPPTLNLKGPLPIFAPDRVEETKQIAINDDPDAEKNAAVVARSGPTPDQSVMRVARAVPLHGKPVAIPKNTPVAVATPQIAKAEESPVKILPALPLASATPALVKASPSPSASPKPKLVVATPTPTPTPLPTPKVVIASSAAPTPKSAPRWQTYKAGQMPRGRLVEVPDLNALAKSGGPRSTTYLQGSFVVKATVGTRAILRADSKFASALGFGPQTQVFVEFPSAQAAPKAGEQLSRGSSRPFQITSVQRGANGQIQVYAREVTEP